MEKIDNILPVTIKKMGIFKPYTVNSVIAHWQEIVGEEIALHTYPQEIQRFTIFVSVDNSVWCHHLSMMKKNIIDKINSFAGEKLVRDIRFQAGYFKNCQNQITDGDEIVSPYNINKIPLAQQELDSIHNTVEGLGNKYLKQKLIRILRKDYALRKIKLQSNWRPCAGCSVLCPPDETYCTACKIQYKEKAINEIIKLLKEVPWIKYHEVLKHVECSEYEFSTAKTILLASIFQQLRTGIMDRVTIMTFIMLTTGAKIEALNDAIIHKTMDKFRRKKDVSASRS
jgi:hypothetical protein